MVRPESSIYFPKWEDKHLQLFHMRVPPTHPRYHCAANRVLLKTGPRPKARNGPAARRPEGPLARSPQWPSSPRPAMAWRPSGPVAQSWFSIVFCPAVNPCACTGLHRVWARKMDDGKFEFVYHYNIKQSFRSFHSLHVAAWKMFSFPVYSSVYKTRKRGPFSTM